MSDIFISYSKADHPLALKLSAFLEAEGWSVWWDKSQRDGDLYRDEIMKQLAAARAVITIWTENSVKSDWVRAEAGRAKADGKLIPVKTAELTYAGIPLPFGEMHTENISSTEILRAAIVAQLEKPAVTSSPFWQVTSTFKYNVLTWIGIVGSAITLFANLNGVLNLADWARELVAHWHDWSHIIWLWMFSWIGIKVPKQFVPLISFLAFTAMVIIGVNLRLRFQHGSLKSQNILSVKKRIGILGLGAPLYAIGALAVWMVALRINSVTFHPQSLEDLERLPYQVYLLHLLQVWIIVIWGLAFPLAYLLYLVTDRLWVLIASVLFLVMAGSLVLVPWYSEASNPELLSDYTTVAARIFVFGLLQLCWMAAILFSPLQQLTRRLAFVVVGLITLVALSEISKLNLHQYLQPPKVSDNSVR